MKKRNYWPLLFIGIFVFTLGMIVYTIKSAINTPVHEDESFLISYHNLDANYNEIIESNVEFRKEYTFELIINSNSLELDTQDIYYSQRVLEKKSQHKDIYKKGNNKLSFVIKNKDGIVQKDLIIEFSITIATNNNSNLNFKTSDLEYKNNTYSTMFEIPTEGNYNITGYVQTVSGKRGYFYIKSNAI